MSGARASARGPDLPEPLRPASSTQVWWHGRRLTYFGGCDYYRMSVHPAVKAAAAAALTRHGVGVAASRLTTGNHPLYEELEAWLARFLRLPGALVVGSGYAANLVVAQALAGEVTHVWLDARAHASLRDAAALLGCPVVEFRHRDPADLRRRLARLPRGARPAVLTDGLFAHDGSLAPLADYLALLPADGWLVVDDAHGLGVAGEHGRGTLEACGVADARVVVCGTLSKAFGGFGGVVAGDTAFLRRIRDRSRAFGASTPPPLPAVAAALAGGRLIAGDAALRARLRAKAACVRAAAREAGWAAPEPDTPILALVPRDPVEAARWRRRLLARGIYPTLIRYPGGPPGGYFRFAISSEHRAVELAGLIEVLRAGP